MNPPRNGQYYTMEELVWAEGTSAPVRSALLTMESRILALEHERADERAAVVAYLRALGPSNEDCANLAWAATQIEDGKHLNEQH